MIVIPWDPNTIPFEAGMKGEICLKKLYQREVKTPFSKILSICALLWSWRNNGHDHRVRQIWRVHLSLLQQTKALCLCQPLFWSMAAMLRDSVVVVLRTRPRAIPLAMITMRKSTHGFPFLSHDEYGAPLGGPSGRRSSALTFCPWIERLNPKSLVC